MRMSLQSLVGRTVIAVDSRPFDDGIGGIAHNPVLTLDDGRRVGFVVEETDVGEYGVFVTLSRKPRKRRGV